MSTPGYFDGRPRPGSGGGVQDSLPHTPTRQITSPISSPSIYRAEEESIIFEIGARQISAGFAGDCYPRCHLPFDPESARRVGDYRKWIPGYQEKQMEISYARWGNDHELWQMDLRHVDLQLVGDKLERAVREAYNKHLLLDYKSARKVIVVIPSILPHPLLNTILTSLFQNPPSPPTVTLYPRASLALVAAGCRSGLVVDIAWQETIVTVIYEYREVKHSFSTRAMKSVTLKMARLLEKADGELKDSSSSKFLRISLEDVEDLTARLAWCRSPDVKVGQDETTMIPLPVQGKGELTLPFKDLAEPAETLFREPKGLDDNEQPLHSLAYRTLLGLPPDIRALCVSRIIVTGDGASIPGLKSRLLSEVQGILDKRGWDPVSGKVPEKRREQLREISGNTTPKAEPTQGSNPANVPPTEAAQPDIDWETSHGLNKKNRQPLTGTVRGVETLGGWAGASLIANLKVRGQVEVDRDTFLQSGMSGARRDGIDATKQTSRAGERTSWTLGAWA